MKHPNRSSEAFGFNLGQAPQLRCVIESGKTTVCGNCETCLLVKTLNPVKVWFSKAGDQSRRRFLLGLVRRLHSVNLLEYFVGLLSPLLCKDFTYARTRTNPSLETDRGTMSSDRALNTFDLDREITKTWYWFQSSNYWTKSNFVLSLFRDCESHLLYLIGVQARTLLASQRKATVPEDDYEASSIASSHYSHESEQHPELDLLRASSRCYSPADTEQLAASSNCSGELLPGGTTTGSPPGSRSHTPASVGGGGGVINDDSGDEGFGDGESVASSSLDPACAVNPTSVAAHAGVARYKDFIGALPVHLSKCILGMMDQVSLHNCVCVSKNWRALVEQVHNEYFVQQHLWEDVMLMQGSGAQGSNPVYAKDIDVAVPNLEPNSFKSIRTDGDVIQTTFKSEVSFTTAYSGYSTRNLIMEERNVYCGAYNVMVLVDGYSNNVHLADPSRVFHTDGHNMIALGFHDRKVRFISSETGREVGPVISGHAGSVRCVGINEEKGYVLSGSYDTSIRCWSLETGKCQKIYRGHRDTIMCLEIFGERFVSGAKDKLCKVWQVATGKCLHTFKHKHPVVAVTMGEDICISGCDGGKVKVWDLKTGSLIKKLTGHHGPVTGIKFDRWHIITASKDGYALAWSSQGDHQRCLSAFRHPKEVLCLEFMFLRVVTGCADGKLRIWNMVNGDCLRIMRGNSRSDPITSLIAIGNRVVLNTPNNLLVLNFEPIEYDYTLETDKMPSLVQYSQYSDAPVRQQPYAYIRAMRMTKAGATNTKIIYHDGSKPEQTYYRQGALMTEQVPHSAKTLSKKSLERARTIQSANQSTRGESLSDAAYMDGRESRRKEARSAEEDGRGSCMKSMAGASTKSVSMSAAARPPVPPARPTTAKSRGTSVKSGTQTVFSVAGFQLGRGGTDDDSDVIEEEEGERQRRVSWAFERPSIPKSKELNLTETKSLLRSQIRATGEVIPPDFIYLTVNTIQASMRASELSKNMEANRREQELQRMKQLGRPSSSPSRIDPRTRLPIDELTMENFAFMDRQNMLGQAAGPSDAQSVAESKASRFTQSSKRTRPLDNGGPVIPTKSVFVRDFNVTPLHPADKNFVSVHAHNLKSSIPKGQILRPHTASAAVPTHGMATSGQPSPLPPRSKSVGYATTSSRPHTAMTSSSSSVAAGAPVQQRRKKYHGFSTSATEPSVVPMLMYPRDMNAHLERLKAERQERLGQVSMDNSQPVVGAVSEFTNPFRAKSAFQLRTHDQVEQEVVNINRNHVTQVKKVKEDADRKQKQLWLNKVKSQMKRDKETDKSKPLKKVMIKKG